MSLSYFAENVGAIEQLWVSDGTPAGTHMVKAFAGNPIHNLTAIGARVYFTVDDGTHGNELWVSDGTAAGTMLVSDINPGATGSNPSLLINVNGELFFAADDGVHGLELWETNGAAAGTMMVKDVDPGAPGSIAGVSFADVNGTLFFTATDGTHGDELWKSDGTAAGTVMVKDINPGATDSFPELLTNVNGTLLFFANDGTHGAELWRSDGTAAGTSLVQDINPGAGSSTPTGFGPMAVVNGTLFFNATDGTHGFELWKSDGTAAGTRLIADINPGSSDSSPQFMTDVNGELFFTATNLAHGFELWKSDGTTAGTMLVKDINPGAPASFVGLPNCTANVGGTLFFTATDGMSGFELWKSDGTAAGTVMVKDIIAGPIGSDPEQLTDVNGVLEFYAVDSLSSTGWGLFRSDGTAAGTFEIATNVDNNTPIGSTPQPVVSDLNGDHFSDILWRNSSGTLADWSMNGGTITSGNALTSGGALITQDSTWSVAGISDFNGDGSADVLWRKTDGTLADWTMNGSTVMSDTVVGLSGVAVKPDASWSVAGVGDFDGDSRSDILWRNTDGTIATWFMNGASIQSSAFMNVGGILIKPDPTWTIAGMGDFNGDDRKDILWRNTSSGETAIWLMNGATITNGADTTFGGLAVRPDASWSVAGVGDFNHDGNSDILWRNSNGTLNEWLMKGSTITASNSITFNGSALAPDASWHLVEIGDFNGDSNSDILWRNDNGAMAEWLMNGNVVTQSVTPTTGGLPITPDASWSTQAKPTIG
jgi:ELWxxDGT repeat protein